MSTTLSMTQKELVGTMIKSWITRKRYSRLLIHNENRDKVAKEIFETEQLYVRNLEIIVQYYLKPLKTIQPPLISPKSIQCIFGHIEDLLTVNRELLNSIQDRMETWKDNKKLGDIFLKLAPYLKMYTEYCSNYDKAVGKLKQKADESKDFALFLKKINSDSSFGLDLTSLLIMPVQRIPRYKLLLQSLIQLTPKEFSDYKVIEEALAKVSEVADHINESIREKQNSEKILTIQRRFTGYVPPLLAPLRTFIREGYLTKVCRKEPKKRWFILFSDAILYGNKIETTVANPIYKFHRLLELSKTKIVNLDDKDAKYKNSFQIIHTSKSFTVFSDNEKEKSAWIQALDVQIKFLSQNEGISVARMNRQYSNIKILKNESEETNGEQVAAPVWIPDSDTNQCMECGVKFTAIRRRHHCRRCGILVCGKCSDQTWKLDNVGKAVRVCRSCYSYLSMTTSRKNEANSSGLVNSPSLDNISNQSSNSLGAGGVGGDTSVINEETSAMSSSEVDSDEEYIQDQSSLTSDSLTELPSITLPPLPSSSSSSSSNHQRSVSPFSPIPTSSISMTQLPTITTPSQSSSNNHPASITSSQSMGSLPPLPSSVNLPPPVVLPPLPSSSSSTPPTTNPPTSTTSTPPIPTSPPPTLNKQNSLLAFCNLVITQNQHVEAAGAKKKPSSTSNSPVASPKVERISKFNTNNNNNNNTTNTIANSTSNSDTSTITLPSVKSISSPIIQENQNNHANHSIVIHNNNNNNESITPTTISSTTTTPTISSPSSITTTKPNNNNNNVNSASTTATGVQVLPNIPTTQQPVLKPILPQTPQPQISSNTTTSTTKTNNTNNSTNQKPSLPSLPPTPSPTPKEVPTKSLPPIPPVPKKSLPPIPPPSAPSTITTPTTPPSQPHIVPKSSSSLNLSQPQQPSTITSPPPIPPKRIKSSLNLGPSSTPPPTPSQPLPLPPQQQQQSQQSQQSQQQPIVGQIYTPTNPPPPPPRRTVK